MINTQNTNNNMNLENNNKEELQNEETSLLEDSFWSLFFLGLGSAFLFALSFNEDFTLRILNIKSYNGWEIFAFFPSLMFFIIGL